jgi:hypothetical protein
MILPLWVVFVGTQVSTWIAKYAIGRARPVFLEGVATATSPSFPSAHASGAAAILGFIAYAVGRDLDPRQRFNSGNTPREFPQFGQCRAPGGQKTIRCSLYSLLMRPCCKSLYRCSRAQAAVPP